MHCSRTAPDEPSDEPSVELSVEELFARYRATREPELLELVFRRATPALVRRARGLVRHGGELEDLVHETYLVAIQRPEEFQPGRSLGGWLYGILRNKARESRRAERNSRSAPVVAEPADDRHFAQSVELNELRQMLVSAVARLPEPYRAVVRLHYEEGLTGEEIARVLGRPPSTVRTQLLRAAHKLRRMLPAGGIALALLAARATAAAMRRAPAPVLPRPRLRSAVPAASLLAILIVTPLILLTQDGRKDAGMTQPVLGAARPALTARPQPATRQPVSSGSALATRPGAEATGPVVVRVLERPGDTPAAGVVIGLRPAIKMASPIVGFRERYVTTNADGIGRFADVGSEPFHVVFSDGIGYPATIRKDGEVIDVHIPPVRRVHGRVFGPLGTPIAGAEVWRSTDSVAYPGFVVARTDAQGRFSASLVPLGRIFLWARASGRADSAVQGFEPSRVPDGAMRFVVGDGEAVLEGRAMHAGKPVPSAIVGAYPLQEPMTHSATFGRTDAHGRFRLAGLLTLEHRVIVLGPAERAGYRRVLARGHVRGVDIQLGATTRVQGVVRDLAHKPIPMANIVATLDVPRLGPHMGLLGRAAWTDDEGRFELVCPVGPTRLRVFATGLGSSIAETRVVLEAEQAFEWNPNARTSALAGTVVDSRGRPIAGATVFVRHAEWLDDDLTYNAPETTDKRGRFAFAGLAPGAYYVSVRTAGGVRGPLPEAIAQARVPQPAPVRLTVPAGDRGGFLVGELVGPRGRPVLGATAIVRPANGHGRGRVALRGASFRLGPLQPGRYALAFHHAKLGALRAGSVEVLQSRSVTVGELRFAKPGGVRISFTMRGGGDPDNVAVRLKENGDLASVERRGNALLGPFAPGRHTLVVFGDNFAPREIAFRVESGHIDDLPCTLEPAPTSLFTIRPEGTMRPGATEVLRIRIMDAAGARLTEEKVRLGDSAQATYRCGLSPGSYAVQVDASWGAHGTQRFRVGRRGARVDVPIR